MSNLPQLMHTYPGITPWNVWELEADTFEMLLHAANNPRS